MTKITVLAGTALLAITGVALAQGGPGERPDRNADVTRQQVIERTDQRFARLDANNDGRFTPEEMRAAGEARRAEMQTRMFDHMDLDHNGSITREEMTQAHTQMREHRGEGGMGGHRGMRHRGPHGPGGPGGPGAHGEHGGPDGGEGHGMRGERMFGEQGFITREQMRERALARFDRADADHNGTLTAAERQAARGAMREGRRERRPG
ncbi:MAG TPA: EF-hand domain-containing protein [Allosphingosinicella sp.]|nr:EF-hand domain-containing protein [Allosphingosinicella sp.]